MAITARGSRKGGSKTKGSGGGGVKAPPAPAKAAGAVEKRTRRTRSEEEIRAEYEEKLAGMARRRARKEAKEKSPELFKLQGLVRALGRAARSGEVQLGEGAREALRGAAWALAENLTVLGLPTVVGAGDEEGDDDGE